MYLTHEDEFSSKDYYENLLKNNEGLNIYLFSSTEDNYLDTLGQEYKNYLMSQDKGELVYLTTKADVELVKYDLIILDSNEEYSIATNEKIKNIAKKISLIGSKHITAVYKYKDQDMTHIKTFYATPNFSYSDKVEVEEIESKNLIDLIAFKHDRNNSMKQSLSKTFTYKIRH